VVSSFSNNTSIDNSTNTSIDNSTDISTFSNSTQTNDCLKQSLEKKLALNSDPLENYESNLVKDDPSSSDIFKPQVLKNTLKNKDSNKEDLEILCLRESTTNPDILESGVVAVVETLI
jgi:hypothetical protein